MFFIYCRVWPNSHKNSLCRDAGSIYSSGGRDHDNLSRAIDLLENCGDGNDADCMGFAIGLEEQMISYSNQSIEEDFYHENFLIQPLVDLLITK